MSNKLWEVTLSECKDGGDIVQSNQSGFSVEPLNLTKKLTPLVLMTSQKNSSKFPDFQCDRMEGENCIFNDGAY